MKNNSHVTALEVVAACGEKFTLDGVEYLPGEVFGKYGIMIGGIRGIVDPNHIVGIPAEAEKLEVMVGTEAFTIELEKNEGDREHSEMKQAVLEGERPAEAEEAKPE